MVGCATLIARLQRVDSLPQSRATKRCKLLDGVNYLNSVREQA